MKIQKIPLQNRLQGLSNCCPAHAEYIPALLQNFSALPISAYLADFPESLERLADLVQYPLDYMEELTYSDIALRIQNMHRHSTAAEALEILAAPLITIYQKHLERGGSNG